ncbi:MAG: hypothetical protein ACF8GE_05910 [Phycisphaerales bacterium JB043]
MRFVPLAVAYGTLSIASIATTSTLARPIESRDVLKTYFETGDVPTEQQFSNFIDSMVNLTGGLHVEGIGVITPPIAPQPGEDVSAMRFDVGVQLPVSPQEYLDSSQFNILMEPDFAGEFGFLALLLNDAGGSTHYGFLQLSMDATRSGPGIHVEYLAFETTPDAPVTTTIIPSPMTGTALVLTGLSAARRRRR